MLLSLNEVYSVFQHCKDNTQHFIPNCNKSLCMALPFTYLLIVVIFEDFNIQDNSKGKVSGFFSKNRITSFWYRAIATNRSAALFYRGISAEKCSQLSMICKDICNLFVKYPCFSKNTKSWLRLNTGNRGNCLW